MTRHTQQARGLAGSDLVGLLQREADLVADNAQAKLTKAPARCAWGLRCKDPLVGTEGG